MADQPGPGAKQNEPDKRDLQKLKDTTHKELDTKRAQAINSLEELKKQGLKKN